MRFFKKIYDRLNEKIIDRYGLAKVLKKYGFYPDCFPITITGEHGPSLLSIPIKEAVKRPSPFYFVTALHKKHWSIKDKLIIRHPSQFVWYRVRRNIKKEVNATGSLFFYSHSSKLIKSITDQNLFFEKLNSLPQEFKPVTICLHFNDVEDLFIEKILNSGFKWVCLSRSYRESQIEAFYNIIPKFRYVLGNGFTSGLLYACEMGIPVSILFLEDVNYSNMGNKSYAYKERTGHQGEAPLLITAEESVRIHDKIKEAITIFNGINTEINNDQRRFTYEILGLDLINSFTNRLKVMMCLYISFIYVSFKSLFNPIRKHKEEIER